MSTHNHIRIVSVGAASQDVFIMGKALHGKRDVRSHALVEQFPLGAKLELDRVVFDTGGGATNAAVTFARQGFSSSYAGKIGKDPAGAEVLRVLKREGVDTSHLRVDERLGTAYSTIMLSDTGERTILAYRGASARLKADDFYGSHIMEGDWMYISSLAGNMDLLKKLLQHAHKQRMKVAFNPGKGELANPKKLRSYLQGVEILMANKEEMQLVFGGERPVDTVLNAMPYCPYIVLTDGPAGSYVSDGQSIYFAGQYKRVKVVDRTGAGDAFCAGFVAAIARGDSVEDALTLGSANSTGVVQQIGAKTGILRTNRLKTMKVKRVSI
ncbi:carbohydrate kinase family protein [Patescibacteria group bacterium]|nr:MAG: carbohydrate kinase family protein [Patescibacteria group bacterium]